MYTIYYNHETNAHSIIDNELKQEFITEDDVNVFEGTLTQCETYLSPLNTIYQTLKTKDSVPTFDEGDE